MRIQELEQRTGLDRATIRYYEREGLILPQREENGYRDYTNEDAVQLERINLLRQLGMSIDKIRSLQKGSDSFSKALQEQINILDGRIQTQKRAKFVCQQIYNDQVTYGALNAPHYLKLLQEEPVSVKPETTQKFLENVPQEMYPWRRYFARCLDCMWFGVLLRLIYVVILRLRPFPTGILEILFTILSGLLFIPLEALFLHKWGTTPGKFAMGIYVETADGVRPKFLEALSRSWKVLIFGRGLGVPGIEIYCNIKNYRILTGKASDRLSSYRSPD